MENIPNQISIPLYRKHMDDPGKHSIVAKFSGPKNVETAKAALKIQKQRVFKEEENLANKRKRLPPIRRLKRDPGLILTDGNGFDYVGESQSSKYSFVVLEQDENLRFCCYPVVPYKFIRSEFKNSTNDSIANNDFKKSDNFVPAKKTKLMNALEKSTSFEPKNELFYDEADFPQNRNDDENEKTGDFYKEQSDDEGQFDEQPIETSNPFEGYEKESRNPETREEETEKKRIIELLQGKTNKATRKREEESILTDISEDSNQSEEERSLSKEKKSIRSDATKSISEMNVVKVIVENPKIGSIELVRKFGIEPNDKTQKKSLVEAVKKVAIMKEQNGRKYFEIKKKFQRLYEMSNGDELVK
ncbi:hypothetical protein MHBO_000058 [Bonamia ostreae]|uniref:Transcription initiation factor IIF subunit alpha n=1 Tax=Bonamia ostreae TaxID=126728 RepID=A0ABV2AEX2_9EUKA